MKLKMAPKMATVNDSNYTYFNSNRYMKNFGSLRHTAYSNGTILTIIMVVWILALWQNLSQASLSLKVTFAHTGKFEFKVAIPFPFLETPEPNKERAILVIRVIRLQLEAHRFTTGVSVSVQFRASYR